MNNFLPYTFFYVVHNGKIVLQIFQSGFFVVCEINRDYTSAQVNFWMRTEDLGPASYSRWCLVEAAPGQGRAAVVLLYGAAAAVCVRLNQVIEHHERTMAAAASYPQFLPLGGAM